MKVKTLIAIAATGLLAASIVSAAPAGGDDSAQGQVLPSAAATSGNIAGANGIDSNDAFANDSSAAPADANNDMSADTATGDDDY